MQVCAVELPWDCAGFVQLCRRPRPWVLLELGQSDRAVSHPATRAVHLCRMGNGDGYFLMLLNFNGFEMWCDVGWCHVSLSVIMRLWLLRNYVLKGIVHPKIIFSYTHLHIVPNLYDFLSPIEQRMRCLAECSCSSFCTMKVNGEAPKKTL